jgi:hypothetical protein
MQRNSVSYVFHIIMLKGTSYMPVSPVYGQEFVHGQELSTNAIRTGLEFISYNIVESNFIHGSLSCIWTGTGIQYHMHFI